MNKYKLYISILLSVTLLWGAQGIAGNSFYYNGTVVTTDIIPKYADSHEFNSAGGSSLLRYGITAGVHATILPLAYNQMISSWGRPEGRFHIKDDWAGDNLGLNDEVSHLFVSYKLMQFLHFGYKSLGFSEKTARIAGIVETAFIVTAVEFPIDAYNPDQGMGLSDLLFDYTGIFLACLKISDSRFDDFDIKTSLRSMSYSGKNVIGSNSEDYDNYIYWLTYSRSPVVFGLGYGTDHPSSDVQREIYFGVGSTLHDLVAPVSKKAAKYLEFTEFYYLNLRFKLLDF
ncbi:MAG: hypothetical protein GF404_10445 [candidate division Zixibacteria bacterium]|nr:hypothetical protein [candidate division Zixibacteria bacterium]